FSELPELQYELHTKKLRIVFFWVRVLLDSMIIPIVLYFVLWKESGLDHNTVYNIISATLAGTCIFEYFQRLWVLGKKSSTCRVSGSKWYYMDSFQYLLSLSLIVIITLVIIGGIPEKPEVRLLAMVAPAFVFMTGLELLVLDFLYLRGIKAPVRLSSIPRKGEMRPAIYLIIEDVTAVDGGGGTAYRERLDKRYQASAHFRRLLIFLSLFWSVPAVFIGSTTVIFVLKAERSVGYVLGWVIPFFWGAIWGAITVIFVKYQLALERQIWYDERARRQAQVEDLILETI
ncbi:hypothetical protein BDZ45DRAFT_601020, partial [Acephala macrosclerotiorum]